MKKNSQIKHVWTVLCRSASIDAETNVLSLLNIPDGLTVGIKGNQKIEGKFSAPIELELVTLWRREEYKNDVSTKVRVELVDPSGDKLMEVPYTLEFPKNQKRMRFRVRIKSINLTTSGQYWFVVYLLDNDKYKNVGSIDLDVIIEAQD